MSIISTYEYEMMVVVVPNSFTMNDRKHDLVTRRREGGGGNKRDAFLPPDMILHAEKVLKY